MINSIKEQDLVELGFEQVNVSAEEAGDDKGFRYYDYAFSRNGLQLISNSDDELVDNGWVVEMFDQKDIVFKDKVTLTSFMELVRGAMIHPTEGDTRE